MASEHDIDRVVEYHESPANRLALAAWAMLGGAFLISMARDGGAGFAVAGFLVLVGSVVFAVYAVMGRFRPLIAASPVGVYYRLRGVGEYLIPWQAIVAIDSADVVVRAGKRPVCFNNLTLLRVPEEFYQRHVHRSSAFRRGPNWDWFFRPEGDTVGIALHHEWFQIPAQDVRGPIEARWHAFRHRPKPEEQTPTMPVRPAFGRRGSPIILGGRFFTSAWSTALIALPVAGAILVLVRLVVETG